MLCIHITSEDEGKHIQVTAECNEYISISSYTDDFIIINSDLVEGIIISSGDCTGHILINSDFTLGMTIYSSYVCHIDTSGYLIIENMFGETDPPEPITVFIIGDSYNEIRVNTNLEWEIQ